MKNSLKVVRRT